MRCSPSLIAYKLESKNWPHKRPFFMSKEPEYHMTYAEIAEALGISSTRVRQLEASALAKLEALPVLQQYHDHINSSSESRSLDLIPFV